MATVIRLRRDTASNWASANSILALGEMGIETNTRKFKFGDGSTAWNLLGYAVTDNGAEAFTDLTDAPASYVGFGGQLVTVNGGETGLEFTQPNTGVRAGIATLASGTATVAADWVTPQTSIVVTPQAAPATPGTALYVDPANYVVGTSFEISSDDAADSRAVFWIASEATITNFVLKSDCGAAASSFIVKDWGSDQTEVWATFDMAMTAAALTQFNANGSGPFSEIRKSDDAVLAYIYELSDSGDFWWIESGNPPEVAGSTPTPLSDTWQTCELHWVRNGTTEFYVNGTLATSAPDSDFADGRKLLIGQDSGAVNANNIIYFRNIKVGTTQGGTDLFQDDFSGGDLSNWSSITGNCTLVADPF